MCDRGFSTLSCVCQVRPKLLCLITVVRPTQILIAGFGRRGARRGVEGGLQRGDVLRVPQVRQHVLQIGAVWSCEEDRGAAQPKSTHNLC